MQTDDRKLGKYDIRGTLGRGATSVVLDGWDPIERRRVAIKVIELPAATDEETLAEIGRFRQEAAAALKLPPHPRVMRLHQYGMQGEQAFLVMEHVDGETLRARLGDADRPLDLADVACVMEGLLDGLAHIHRHGIIHRDIKPANVMLAKDGRPTITDFGIALTRQAAAGARELAGTPNYMAPEQFAFGAVDERADIYAAGVVLYETVTGRKPFTGSDREALQRAIQTQDAPPPSSLSVMAFPALDRVVRQAMARRPQERYASAGAFAEDLRRALQDQSNDSTSVIGQAAPVPPSRPTSRPSRNRRAWLPAGLAAAFILIGLGATGYWWNVKREQAAQGKQASETAARQHAAQEEAARDKAAADEAAREKAEQAEAARLKAAADEAVRERTRQAEVAREKAVADGVAREKTRQAEAAQDKAGSAVAARQNAEPVKVAPATITAGEPPIHPPAAEGCAGGQDVFAAPREIDPVQCQAFRLAQDVPAPRTAAVAVRVEVPSDLHQDQLLQPTILLPKGGQLRVDYVLSNGLLVHLFPTRDYVTSEAGKQDQIAGQPQRRFARDTRLSLGRGGPASDDPEWQNPTWPIAAPYGTDLVLATVSSQPFAQPPDDAGQGANQHDPNEEDTKQSASAYLGWLRAEIERLRHKGSVAVVVVPVRTQAQ